MRPMSGSLKYREIGRCEFPPDPLETRAALRRIQLFLQARGASEEAWGELELALAEGLNNAVEHGCKGIANAKVEVSWHWDGDRFFAEIADPGVYTAPIPETSEGGENLFAEGGYGLMLLSELVEEIQHRQENGRHILSFERKIGFAKWDTANAAEAEHLLQAITADLSDSYENLAALFRFAETLATTRSLEEFLEETLGRLLTLIGADFAQLRLSDPEKLILRTVPVGQIVPLGPSELSPEAATVEAQVFRDGTECTIENRNALEESDPLFAPAGGAFLCPVQFRGEVIGVLATLCRDPSRFFTAGELSLVRLVADYVGLAKANSDAQGARVKQEKAAKELEIAASIQQSLLPRSFPVLPGYRIFGECLSAQEIGGDFFDVIEMDGPSVLLLIADVMGKGVPAALLARMLRTALRSRVESSRDPGGLLTALNRQLAEELGSVDMFITAQLVRFDIGDHRLHFANAGHGPVYRLERNGTLGELEAEGIPIGIFPDMVYETREFEIGPGDRFYLATDGLFEASSPEGEPLGLDGFAALLRKIRTKDIRQDCLNILQAVREIPQAFVAQDDQTIVAFERND